MIGENTNNAFVSFIQSLMASLFSFKCEGKLSFQDTKALVALFAPIHGRELSVAKVKGEEGYDAPVRHATFSLVA